MKAIVLKVCMCSASKKINLAWVLEFWLDSLGQLLPQFHTPLIIGVDVPDHLEIFITSHLNIQLTPWVKILCSYMAMRAPRVKGLIWSTMMLLVGLLPVNSLWGAILSISDWLLPAFFSSATTWGHTKVEEKSLVKISDTQLVLTISWIKKLPTWALSFPLIRASVWAKKLESRMVWWSLPSLASMIRVSKCLAKSSTWSM